MRIRDPDPGWKNSDPGWKKIGSGIRNPEKHPGSATLSPNKKFARFTSQSYKNIDTNIALYATDNSIIQSEILSFDHVTASAGVKSSNTVHLTLAPCTKI
jgi:hypothetical protein